MRFKNVDCANLTSEGKCSVEHLPDCVCVVNLDRCGCAHKHKHLSAKTKSNERFFAAIASLILCLMFTIYGFIGYIQYGLTYGQMQMFAPDILSTEYGTQAILFGIGLGLFLTGIAILPVCFQHEERKGN